MPLHRNASCKLDLPSRIVLGLNALSHQLLQLHRRRKAQNWNANPARVLKLELNVDLLLAV
ncbi:MAG: hypothetical protein Aurels2KO_36290 [Aureliella sp.]